MAMTITTDFAIAKEAEGYQPVFLVELPGLGKFYATREPAFSGVWLAGESLMAGSGILANANHPTYETVLRQLRQGGVGTISYELDSSGFARTNNAAVSFLNGEYLSHTLQELDLSNAPVLIRMGFYGQTLSDYVSIFRGVVEDSRATFEALDFSLVDDTLVQFVPLPPQIGSDFLPRAFDQGKAIPIVLGDVENVPVIQTIGAVADKLAFEADGGSTYILTRNVNAKYPPTGTITVTSVVGVSTVTYSSVSTYVEGNQIFTRLNLSSSLSYTHPSGSDIALASFKYTYIFGFAVQNVRRIRKAGYTHPTVAPRVTNIALDAGDYRRLTQVEFSSEQETITASVSSEARGRNLFPNGLQNHNAADDLAAEGWTLGNGSWDRYLPGSTYDYVLRGRTNVDQAVPSDAYIDLDVTEGGKYRLTFTMKNVDAKFVEVGIGTPGESTAYYVFSELTNTDESLFDLTFVATDSTLRVTLQIENFTPPHAATTVYFDQFDLYDLGTENPATQIQYLIDTHMPGIIPHAASFEESRELWQASGDRCAGMLQQTEETQALLGRIAQQFRAKTFLNESGEQKLVVFDQSRIPTYRFNATHTSKGSVKVGKSSVQEIYTHFYVYFGRAPQDLNETTADLGGREAFSGVVFCTPYETNHSTEPGLYLLCEEAKRKFRTERTLEIFGDLIPDVATAENTLAYIVRRGTHQRYQVEFQTFLNALDVEVTDFVKIVHPLLPPDHRTNSYEVVSKQTLPNGCNTQFVCEEINPFAFGGYTEHWEPPTRLLPFLAHYEAWNLPPDPDVAYRAGTAFACNPYTERWSQYTHFYDYALTPTANIIYATAESITSLGFDNYLYPGQEPSGFYSGEMVVEFQFNPSSAVHPVTDGGGFTHYYTVQPVLDLRSFCLDNEETINGVNILGFFQLHVACLPSGQISMTLQSRPKDRGYFAPPIDLSASVIAASGLSLGDAVKVRFRWECSEDPAINPQPHVLLMGDIWNGSEYVAKVDACHDYGHEPGTIDDTTAVFMWNIDTDIALDSEGRASLSAPVREVFTAGNVTVTAASLYTLLGYGLTATLIHTETWEPPIAAKPQYRALTNYRRW